MLYKDEVIGQPIRQVFRRRRSIVVVFDVTGDVMFSWILMSTSELTSPVHGSPMLKAESHRSHAQIETFWVGQQEMENFFILLCHTVPIEGTFVHSLSWFKLCRIGGQFSSYISSNSLRSSHKVHALCCRQRCARVALLHIDSISSCLRLHVRVFLLKQSSCSHALCFRWICSICILKLHLNAHYE